jgi:hypothetical protein
VKIAIYGSSLLSAYWNGAATYYRGILRALAPLGHEITFFEPDAFDRQSHRDIDPPAWCRVVVYQATEAGVRDVLAQAARADVVIKASGVGVFDDALLDGVLTHAAPGALRLFWDVDAPATLAEIAGASDHALCRALPHLDLVLTYGGGDATALRSRQVQAVTQRVEKRGSGVNRHLMALTVYLQDDSERRCGTGSVEAEPVIGLYWLPGPKDSFDLLRISAFSFRQQLVRLFLVRVESLVRQSAG